MFFLTDMFGVIWQESEHSSLGLSVVGWLHQGRPSSNVPVEGSWWQLTEPQDKWQVIKMKCTDSDGPEAPPTHTQTQYTMWALIIYIWQTAGHWLDRTCHVKEGNVYAALFVIQSQKVSTHEFFLSFSFELQFSLVSDIWMDLFMYLFIYFAGTNWYRDNPIITYSIGWQNETLLTVS